jgi:3-hydroxybutyryl-CoA dehydrogenase
MLRCASSFVIAAYGEVRIIPQDSRALPAPFLRSRPIFATFKTFYGVVRLEGMEEPMEEGRPMNKIGVVGAGTMGSQIALVFADSGLETTLYDLTNERLGWGVKNIEDLLSRQVAKGKRNAEGRQAALTRIRTTSTLADLADADLVVEAVFEEIKTKREVFGELDRVCAPMTILATNTSTLSVSEIAAATGRPALCIGTHFLIPAAP